MSRIDKLAILGVRSFDNTCSQTIQFHTPLTLIVGYNGSGKTTIIECLKYATTGDQPPNSKGGAFIHDPKMCGEKEVLAQVKLSFKSTSGAKMVCTRSLQLIVKKNTRQVKTLEGQLKVERNGERSTISSRCAELDTVMPQYLGVSKAVLEYVIFCHQDESLWPMSEPAVLKKRFDEIFEALKYTKAIDNIKVLRKKQNEELGKLKILLEQYRTDKDRGERASRRAEELHNEIESMREQVTELGKQISDITTEQKELFATARGFEKILATLSAKRQEAATMEAYITDLSEHIIHLEESDEDLHNMQNEYAQRLQTYEQHIRAKKDKHAEANRKLENTRSVLGQKLTEEGRIQAEATAFEAQIQERAALIREISRRHGIKGFDSELDDSQIQLFMEKISKQSRDQNLQLERLKRENGESLRVATEELNKLTSKRSSLNQRKEYARAQIKSSNEKAINLQHDLDKIGVNEGQEAILLSNLEAKEQRLTKAKEDLKNAEYEHRTQVENLKLRETEEKLDRVTEELAKGTRQADDRARLGFVKKELETRKKALEVLSAANKDKIDRVVGGHWSAETVEKDLQTVLEQREEEVLEVTRQRDGINQELSQIETRINMASDSFKNKKKEEEKCKGTVLDSWYRDEGETANINDYPTVAQGIEDQLQEARGALKNLDFMHDYLKRAITVVHQHKACALCKRGFASDEIPDFSARIQVQLEKLVKKSAEEDISVLEDDLKLIRNAAPSYDTYVRLSKTEIPALKTELEKHKITKDQLVDQYNKYDKLLNDRAYTKSEVEALKVPVAEIAKYTREVAEYEHQVEDVSSQLKDMGGARTIEEMQKEMQQLNDEAKVIKKQLNFIASEKETALQTINTLDGQVRDIRMKLNELRFKLQQSAALRSRIDECRDMNRKQNAIIDETDAEINQLAPEVTKADANVQEIAREGAEKEKKHQREAARLAESDMQLKRVEQGIQNYLHRGGPEQLARCRQQTSDLRHEVKNLQDEFSKIGDEVNKLEKEYTNAGATERSIAENLRFRRDKRSLEKTRAEIEELASKNAEEQAKKFNRDAERLSNRHLKLSGDKSAIVGEMRSKDRQLVQLMQDYATDYADAKIKYRETLAKVQTTTGASSDLAKYGNALDKAVMKYHSLKMEEINRIIEELWKSTYRGTDVDTIMIRSEGEPTKTNRSYNYRVCMMKQDAEMDMRGRCSAGQKVLASIIIRLALAECFGINCGLIALDEPTTNLDSDNIKSLAKSLHDIIQTRMTQANFQLIVITHDEDFLKEMKCQDYCDHYYRVSRNDRQKSVIESQSIAEVL